MAHLFTTFQVIWAIYWAGLHIFIRRGRGYGEGRQSFYKNKHYKAASTGIYVLQNSVVISSFYGSPGWLLSLHDQPMLVAIGALLVLISTALYSWSILHLGGNYAPCYDAHLPRHLVVSGPYRFIRHPMYLAKLVLALGTLFLSRSLLLFPAMAYLVWDTMRSFEAEETFLNQRVSGFTDYSRRTSRLIPGLF